MNGGSYRFKFGPFACTALSDGSLDYPLKNFFANVPLEQIERALRERGLPLDHITTPYTYLHVDTGEHRVLVDMGAGKLGPHTGRLRQSMQEAGIDPAVIDVVVITHAHPDHIGGALDDGGAPIYANAHYYMCKGEWDFWASDGAFAKVPEHFVTIARAKLAPIQERLVLVDHECEVLPGIWAIPAPGHTPGHMVVAVRWQDEQLLYISDTVLHPLHLEHPDWLPVFDVLPKQAAASKRRIFDLAAETGALVMGQHFPPFPSLGHVIRQGGGWRWQPIVPV